MTQKILLAEILASIDWKLELELKLVEIQEARVRCLRTCYSDGVESHTAGLLKITTNSV